METEEKVRQYRPVVFALFRPNNAPHYSRCGTVVIGYPEAGKTLQFLPCCIPPSTYVRPAPFDAIHVGAAAPTLPAALVDQLARPGRMFIPVGTHTQQVLQVRFRSSTHAYLNCTLICSYCVFLGGQGRRRERYTNRIIRRSRKFNVHLEWLSKSFFDLVLVCSSYGQTRSGLSGALEANAPRCRTQPNRR